MSRNLGAEGRAGVGAAGSAAVQAPSSAGGAGAGGGSRLFHALRRVGVRGGRASGPSAPQGKPARG